MHWCVSSPFIRWIDRDMSLQRTKYLIDEYSDDIEDEDDLPLFEEEDDDEDEDDDYYDDDDEDEEEWNDDHYWENDEF